MKNLMKSLGHKQRKGGIITCQRCGKKVYLSPSVFLLKCKKRYCSLDCHNKEQHDNRNMIKCFKCGKITHRNISKTRIPKHNYCSKKCMDEGLRKKDSERVTPRNKKTDGLPPEVWSTKYADIRFGLLIRKRDGKCIKCGKKDNLQCSHFWGRGNSSTRFHPENCDTLCLSCHWKWEGNMKGEYRQFKLKQLGAERYIALQRLSAMVMKREEAIIRFQRTQQ